MIHHLSIAAADPKRVADVFAELFDGATIPFPPAPGAFMALARDLDGTAVEVYPAGSQLKPNGQAGADFVRSSDQPAFGSVHFALSVDCPLSKIEAIAAREGWECHVCNRGGDFDVVEFWIENHFLVELLPPAFAARYLAFCRQFVGDADPRALMASHHRPVPA